MGKMGEVVMWGKTYRISYGGEVTVGGVELEFGLRKRGFVCRNLRIGSKVKTIYLHRMVAGAWGMDTKGNEVYHKDGNRENNNVVNLGIR